MLDTYTSENNRDFNARYAGTYGWLVVEGVKRFIYISDVDNNNVYFNTGADLRYNARIDAGVTFEFIPVDRGFFRTITGGVYLLSRVPARQWKRGISASNTEVYDINIGGRKDVTYKLLESIFRPDNKIYSDVYVPFESCALSKHFAITPEGFLFFYKQVVGVVAKGVIKLSNPLVLTEIKDVISRRNLNLKVAE